LSFLFVISFLILWRVLSFLGQAWAEGKGELATPPSRGQRTGNGRYVIRRDFYRSHANDDKTKAVAPRRWRSELSFYKPVGVACVVIRLQLDHGKHRTLHEDVGIHSRGRKNIDQFV
jgi:hypothetical protein